MMNQMTTLGMSPRLERVLTYSLGWITGIIFFFLERNRSVRWHAAQSMITFGLLSILIFGITLLRGVLGAIVGWIPILGSLLNWLTGTALGLVTTGLSWVTLILWVWLMVMAFIREDYSLPIIGGWVRNIV